MIGGPAGTFWNPANRVEGDYTATATFNLMRPSGHTNYYGLTFGGEDLAGAGQKYLYFLVAQNGNYLIKTRSGEDVSDVQASTPHAAVRQPDANGRSINTLEVRVAGRHDLVCRERHRRAHDAQERRHRGDRRPRGGPSESPAQRAHRRVRGAALVSHSVARRRSARNAIPVKDRAESSSSRQTDKSHGAGRKSPTPGEHDGRATLSPRARSSVGQSTGLLSRWSQVRVLPGAPLS